MKTSHETLWEIVTRTSRTGYTFTVHPVKVVRSGEVGGKPWVWFLGRDAEYGQGPRSAFYITEGEARGKLPVAF